MQSWQYIIKILKLDTWPDCLGKPQKKVIISMAGPLRGGGVKGRTLKKKDLFWNFDKILLPFDNLSKYGQLTLKFVGRYFIWVVTIFSKKKGYLSPKIGGRKKLSKSVCGYFIRRKKIIWPLSNLCQPLQSGLPPVQASISKLEIKIFINQFVKFDGKLRNFWSRQSTEFCVFDIFSFCLFSLRAES